MRAVQVYWVGLHVCGGQRRKCPHNVVWTAGELTFVLPPVLFFAPPSPKKRGRYNLVHITEISMPIQYGLRQRAEPRKNRTSLNP